MRVLSLFVSLCCLPMVVAERGAADPKKEDVPALIKALKNKSPKVRISAAEDLGHMGAVQASDTKEAVPVLIELLKKDKDANVRKAVATALGKIDPDSEKAIPALVNTLKGDKAKAVRIAAAEALGRMGSDAKEAIPDLEAAKKGADKDVSKAAGRALKSIRGQKKQ